MRKIIGFIFVTCLAGLLCSSTALGFKWPWEKEKTIKIGINAPITGDIPKVGEGSKFAAQMWLEDVNKGGGLDIGGVKYKVEIVLEDNESKAESAVFFQGI